MSRTWLSVLALPIVLISPLFTDAGEKTVETPTVVMRARSLDALLQNVNLVVKLVGQEEAARQIEGLIKSKTGKKGIQGIDTARPFGAYVRFGSALDEINGAVLIPIADEQAVLALLDNLGIGYQKDKQGVYSYRSNNIDFYFRFAHKYLCISAINTESLQDKNLPNPAKALAISGESAVSIVARVDQIPNDAKLIALAQLEESILAARKKGPPAETKAQEEFRLALLDDMHRLAKGVIREAAEIRFDLDINEKTGELSVDFSIKPKQDTDLAASIKQLGSLKSTLVGPVAKDVAFQGTFHLVLPSAMQKALNNVIDEAMAKSLEGVQDKAKRKQVDALFKALAPTAKSGANQAMAAVVGPSADRYTILVAVKLTDGDKLGKTVHDLVTDALKTIPEEQRGKIQLNFDNAGPHKIHKFVIPSNPTLEEVVGDSALFVAFREDGLFVALGKDALPTLKTALSKTESTGSPPLVFDLDVARMAHFIAQTQEQKDLAAKLFPKGQGGRVRLSVEAGSTLTARMQIRLNALEFLVKMKDAK